MSRSSELLNAAPAALREQMIPAAPLSQLTTLRIGGPATLVCPIRTPDEARRFQAFAHQQQLSLFVLGAGSNVLADDAGYPGLVLRVVADHLTRRGDTVTVGAGLAFDELIARSLNLGLTGLEFASGIPGTLGGALVGNAGCYGHEIGEFLVEAVVLDQDGSVERVGPEHFGFGYRETRLRERGGIVLEATLKLATGTTDQALGVRAERIADRRTKHPVDLPSAGSWFRNLPAAEPGGLRQAAGRLLEEAGAKEMVEGDARVFAGHANMIVNTGHASSNDVIRLARRMQEAVAEKFGIRLMEEVRYLGPAVQPPVI